jgi:hypothetical protein
VCIDAGGRITNFAAIQTVAWRQLFAVVFHFITFGINRLPLNQTWYGLASLSSMT